MHGDSARDLSLLKETEAGAVETGSKNRRRGRRCR